MGDSLEVAELLLEGAAQAVVLANFNKVGDATWGFYLAIRDAEGDLGLSDPDVENSDTCFKVGQI